MVTLFSLPYQIWQKIISTGLTLKIAVSLTVMIALESILGAFVIYLPPGFSITPLSAIAAPAIADQGGPRTSIESVPLNWDKIVWNTNFTESKGELMIKGTSTPAPYGWDVRSELIIYDPLKERLVLSYSVDPSKLRGRYEITVAPARRDYYSRSLTNKTNKAESKVYDLSELLDQMGIKSSLVGLRIWVWLEGSHPDNQVAVKMKLQKIPLSPIPSQAPQRTSIEPVPLYWKPYGESIISNSIFYDRSKEDLVLSYSVDPSKLRGVYSIHIQSGHFSTVVISTNKAASKVHYDLSKFLDQCGIEVDVSHFVFLVTLSDDDPGDGRDRFAKLARFANAIKLESKRVPHGLVPAEPPAKTTPEAEAQGVEKMLKGTPGINSIKDEGLIIWVDVDLGALGSPREEKAEEVAAIVASAYAGTGRRPVCVHVTSNLLGKVLARTCRH